MPDIGRLRQQTMQSDRYNRSGRCGSSGSSDPTAGEALHIRRYGAADRRTWNSRIQKFLADGSFLAKWGSKGNGDGQFLAPSGIAVDAAGNIYVGDMGNHRIQKFRWMD